MCTAMWWLQSPGYFTDYATYVIDIGYMNYNGNLVCFTDPGVRPALRLNR